MSEPGTVELLLVEDNPADAELAERALRQARPGCSLHHVEDGQAALDFLFAEGAYAGRSNHHPPRLVVLDLKLPRLDGIEVLRRLRGDERTRGTPVVVLTSSREPADIAACYRLGANSYVVKPVEFARFMEVVTRLGTYWLGVNEPPE